MQRYEISIQQPWNTHATVHGEWVKFTDAQATIARLTAELAQARAEAAAAYERAAAAISDTDALAEIVKRAVDAETRACAEVFSHPEAKMVRDRIIARIDQRKGGRE